jgi:hypothetical protein
MSTLDYYILIPIVVRFIVVAATNNYLAKSTLTSPIIILIASFLALLFANFFRKLAYCGNKSDYDRRNSEYMSGAAADTFIVFGVTEFLMGLYNIFIFKYLRNINNTDLKTIITFALFTNALWSLILKDIYSIVNKSKDGAECTISPNKISGSNTAKYTIGIFLLIIGFGLYYLSFVKFSFKAEY